MTDTIFNKAPGIASITFAAAATMLSPAVAEELDSAKSALLAIECQLERSEGAPSFEANLLRNGYGPTRAADLTIVMEPMLEALMYPADYLGDTKTPFSSEDVQIIKQHEQALFDMAETVRGATQLQTGKELNVRTEVRQLTMSGMLAYEAPENHPGYASVDFIDWAGHTSLMNNSQYAKDLTSYNDFMDHNHKKVMEAHGLDPELSAVEGAAIIKERGENGMEFLMQFATSIALPEIPNPDYTNQSIEAAIGHCDFSSTLPKT